MPQGGIRNKGGNRKSDILARLATHAPKILNGYERGEFKSARAAGIAAGFIKVLSPLEAARKAVGKLSDGEWRQLMRDENAARKAST